MLLENVMYEERNLHNQKDFVNDDKSQFSSSTTLPNINSISSETHECSTEHVKNNSAPIKNEEYLSLAKTMSIQDRRKSYTDEINIFTNQIIFLKNNTYSYKQSISNCLGQGSYGRVFKGTTANNVGVAVKEMLSVFVKENEMQVMKLVSSDFLVKLLDICQDNISFNTYLIMELCDTDLMQFLKMNNVLYNDNLRVVIDNVVRGYFALYQNKIVHRDLKPQNILIMLDKNVCNNVINQSNVILSAKITDFGISRVLENDDDGESMQLSNVAGTLHYMAPEVGVNLLHVSNYNYPVDIWSMGCVFYECLMGKIPFDEKEICRLFLYAAGKNYDAYEKPSFEHNNGKEYHEIIDGMLEIDDRKRTKPKELLKYIETL
uniref:Protein kinase domain-containing protein n=1 Tax=Parastrongyloides trichosuri TaxID=131310 RepID=A0A0N4ZAD9_PARTI